MSAAVVTALKKIAVTLLTDKKGRKAVGSIIAISVTLALLPAMVLMAIGNHFSGGNEVNYDEYVRTLSEEQKSQISQIESDGKQIAKEMTALNGKKNIVKAQMIYLTYFENVQKSKTFFKDFCKTVNECRNEEILIKVLNMTYNLSIDYEEFMRSYSMISNVSIDKNLFLNLRVKNNIDLAAWCENAYETAWGFVPHTNGNILSEEKFRSLKKKYPEEITESCEVLKGRRTVDNIGLITSYLCYDAESRRISEENPTETAQTLYEKSAVRGDIETFPNRLGTAVISGDVVGIYVGEYSVVYAKSVDEGIVKEPISEGKWTAWFEISDVQYGDVKSFSNEIMFDEYDANKKNNLGLVQWAIQAHKNGWGYIYGTYGNILTEDLLQDRAAVFGCEVTDYMDFIRENWLGKRTADCVGLIKGYGWYDSKTGEIVVGSNGMMDVGANAMYQNAEVKGTIDTIPEVPGLAVWSDGHIGIYIGNGEVIEAANTLRGVMRSQLAGREWTHWLQIPYIDYVENMEEEK